ncbi:hypothetical protein [Roseococcus sp. YIM B11640]|uniref:hypothetical protein n=1 Tax=Roseococcus sp. YIM B11640 TaxID=3133973 RepID=UPI003C7E2A5A
MRRLLILLALAPMLMGQGIPRSNCGFSEGWDLLRSAEREAAKPVAGITEGRERGEAVLAALRRAAGQFLRCGCPRLAEMTQEAAVAVASAPSEASVARLTTVLGNTRFRIQLAREFFEAQSCR